MNEPLLLALDTSTSTAGVALFDGRQVLSETTWLAGREHSTRLLAEVQVAMERIGRGPGDLTGLVVARGPGSFTGVRVALSVAKGMAAALALPVWGVSSLEALALAFAPSDLAVRAVLEAGRRRFATALYRQGVEIEGPSLVTLEELVESIVEPTVVTGELSADARKTLSTLRQARLPPAAACIRRAGFVAELGWRRAHLGDPGDPQTLDALYISY